MDSRVVCGNTEMDDIKDILVSETERLLQSGMVFLYVTCIGPNIITL